MANRANGNGSAVVKKKRRPVRPVRPGCIGKLVHVYWHDAYSDSGWHSNGEVDRVFLRESTGVGHTQGYACENIGWVIRDNSKGIVLAGRISRSTSMYGCLQFIPRGMITRLAVIASVTAVE